MDFTEFKDAARTQRLWLSFFSDEQRQVSEKWYIISADDGRMILLNEGGTLEVDQYNFEFLMTIFQWGMDEA